MVCGRVQLVDRCSDHTLQILLQPFLPFLCLKKDICQFASPGNFQLFVIVVLKFLTHKIEY